MGYLRDIRRLTVALSRARLGLYILGRREVFESCLELRQAFEILLQRPDKLMLVTGELWPSSRILNDEEGKPVPGETPMEGVEHLGQYVFEMTNAKVQQIKAEMGVPPDAPLPAQDTGAMEDGYEGGATYYADEDIEEEVKDGFEVEEQ